MGKNLVSVIVPVYKVEKYLNRCVDSILTQSYTNLEIILVDDGSPDKSGEICDYYSKKDSRVKVFHQQNMGLSEARNTGLNNINGEYVLFVDSDDWIDKNTVKDNLEIAVKEKADMVVFNYYDVYSNGQKKYNHVIKNGEIPLEQVFLKGAVLAVVKLYKAHLFDKLRFKKGLVHEDSYIFPLLLIQSKKIIGNTEAYYFYNHTNNTSILHTVNYRHRYDDFLANVCKLNVAEKYFPNTYPIVLNRYADNFFKLNNRDKILHFLNLEEKENMKKFILVCQEKRNLLSLKENMLLWDYEHGNVFGLIKGIFYCLLSKR